MSLLTKGYGGNANSVLTQGFISIWARIKEVIVDIAEWFREAFKPKRKRAFFVFPLKGTLTQQVSLSTGLKGTLTVPSVITSRVKGTLLSPIQIITRTIGSLSIPFTETFKGYAQLIIPIKLVAPCKGTLVHKISNSFTVLGEKTFKRLKLILALLEEE